MSYYNPLDSSRRCRRCKRKRLDDEPAEVRQYKTCAKCRIIERQKKKLKKPLAEETMVYGMRQLQEQQPGSWSEDLFNQDDVFVDDSHNPLNVRARNAASAAAAAAEAAVANATSHSSLVATAAAAVSAGGVNDVFPAYQTFEDQFEHQKQQQQQQQHHQQQQQQQQQHYQHHEDQAGGDNDEKHNGVGHPSNGTDAAIGYAIQVAPSACEVCGAQVNVAGNNLCHQCQSDPYRLPHVYGDFSDFLQQVSPNGQSETATRIFIKQVVAAPDFNENVDTNNVNPNNERQYRELVLNSIKQIYLNPVMAATGYKFVRVSSNLALSSHNAPKVDPVSGKYVYRDTQRVKALYRSKAEESQSEILLYVTYDTSANLIVIKITWLPHKKEEGELIVTDQAAVLTEERSLTPQREAGGDIETELELEHEGEVDSDRNDVAGAQATKPSSKFPLKFVQLVDLTLKSLVVEEAQDASPLGYNESTGKVLFDTLLKRKEEYPDDIRNVVAALEDRDEFAREFVGFKELVTNMANGAEVRPTESEAESVELEAATSNGEHDAAQDDTGEVNLDPVFGN